MGWTSQYFTTIIISGTGSLTGLFEYSPTPALNNLISSDVAQSGFDSFGNAVLEGKTVYGGTANKWQALSMQQGGILNWYTSNAVNMTGPWTLQGQMSFAANLPVSFSNSNFGFSFSDSVTADIDLSVIGNLRVTDPTTSGPSFTRRIRPVGIDTSVTTVTSASFQQCTKSWTIPANDPIVNSGYRLKAWGGGTWGSTQQALSFRGNFTGLGGLGKISIGSAFLNASLGFSWVMEIDFIVTATGASGSWIANSRLDISFNGGNTIAGNAANNAEGAASTGSGSNDINTMSSMAMWLEAQWASTTGAPTVTCLGSTFEPIGS